MPYQFRCSNKVLHPYTQCSICDSEGKLLTVFNHSKIGSGCVKCPKPTGKPVTLDYEGVSNDNLPQEYLPDVNKGKAKAQDTDYNPYLKADEN
jgi:hypothetical protein